MSVNEIKAVRTRLFEMCSCNEEIMNNLSEQELQSFFYRDFLFQTANVCTLDEFLAGSKFQGFSIKEFENYSSRAERDNFVAQKTNHLFTKWEDMRDYAAAFYYGLI